MITNQSVRKMISRVAMMLLFMLFTTASAWADNSGSCGSGVTFAYNESDHTLTIGGTGAMTDFTNGEQPWYSYRTNITTLVIEEGVTHIGNNSFREASYITSVTLPASVNSIGDYAFQYTGRYASDCPFTAAENSQLTSIGTHSFTKVGGNVDLRNCKSLTTIGENVFMNFKKTVYLPVSTRTIVKDAFYNTGVNDGKPTVRVAYDKSTVFVVNV